MTVSGKVINVDLLENIIVGRVEPQIYAFSTETVPNYLKVGDTYRPLEKRLKEWREYFPDLKKKFNDVAKINDETFFRDYAVHHFLETEIQKERLQPSSEIKHYSREFFKNTTKKDVVEAIDDIKQSYNRNEGKYQYYKFEESRIPVNHTYQRTEDYGPRPNQQKAINNFKRAVKNKRTNLLMYAVMRFGKSFTSLCCAKEMGAEVVLVVSAKADVKEEWKKTVESHKSFSEYVFLDGESLLQSDTVVAEKQEEGKNIVIFLTLQDLQGDTIKQKHTEVFEKEVDLLIVDETHFGARAAEYGKVLKDAGFSKSEIRTETKTQDDTLDEAEELTKTIKAKVRLHLSGTPYRILMGSEFEKEDIIAFYQFSDITDDQKKWDEKYLSKDGTAEWDNPYYGFPQMVRFAFNPNESSRKKMEELRAKGFSYALSELFRPRSIQKDIKHNLHKEFIHEQEITDLLKVIDGSKEDENLLSFLDYEKLKQGKMCRHIVCVLPYRASCDALESLLKSKKFKNLNTYKILNISGVDGEKIYKKTQTITSKIKKYESENKKTITLTVNRMLTGSTVPEWDTMLYFKDTSSPQEYDQAVFRLQNQYIRTYKDPAGDIVKFNMKPQTLLVDFNPNRMFQMQEEKAKIYNVNTDSNGNSRLEERVRKELEISPIIVVNNKKMVQVTPANIFDAVRQYSVQRSVVDEATSIAIDPTLLDIQEIKAEIERQNELGSKAGIKLKAAEGEGDELDIDDQSENSGEESLQPQNVAERIDEENYKAKFAMYYARILFFALLTDTRVKSLQEVIKQINAGKNNVRIARNLDLRKEILVLLQKHINPFVLSELDYKIQNINSLANDSTVQPAERAGNALKKFSRLSSSEIVTPEWVADKMIDTLPKDAVTTSTKILDIASKQGEFLYAVYKKYGKDVAKNFYSIPTSKVAYEFTRKMYNLLDLDEGHLESGFTSYDLIQDEGLIKENSVKINGHYMKVDAIVGNPPYQLDTDNNRDTPIYHWFIEKSYSLSNHAALVTPARFLFDAGQTPKTWNEKMLKDPHLKVVFYQQKSNEVFPDTDIKGGVVITYRDDKKDFGPIGTFSTHPELNSILEKIITKQFTPLNTIHYGNSSYKLTKEVYGDFPDFQNRVTRAEKNSVGSNIFVKYPEMFFENRPEDDGEYVKILGRIDNKRIFKWTKRTYISHHPSLEKWKVFLPGSNGTGVLGETLSSPIVCGPSTGCTQTFISFGAFESKLEAESVLKYLKTKFTRALLATQKVTHNNKKKSVWKNIPLQVFSNKSDIDWSKSISEIDQQLYKKYKLTKKETDFIEGHIKPMV